MRTFQPLLLLPVAALVGCAQVPTVPEPLATDVPAQVTVSGARGALSQRAANAVLRQLAEEAPDADALRRHLAVEQVIAGAPLYTGNRVTILRDGPETFAAIFAAIRAARHYLYLEYYTFEEIQNGDERLSDLLIRRQGEGVHITVLYDSVGSIATPGELFERLGAAGIRVCAFNPLNPLTGHFAINDRDHRKLLLADGQIAIIGGVNLSTDYQSAPVGSGQPQAQPPWHDTDLRIEGPAVDELKHLFDEHWRQQGGDEDALVPGDGDGAAQGDQVVRIVGSQAGGRLSPRYYATLVSSIRSAEASIDVTAAYFAPTRQESSALLRAARRGVRVRLLLPSQSDSFPVLAVQRSHYHSMLRAGIQIYERQDGILHSKIVVADGVWSIVGSSNFDHRSVLFNDEIDAVVIGSQTGQALESYLQQDLQHAQRIDAASWEHRPFGERVRERFWRLWETLL
ncbi:MAG TPA: phospholipase D-like domain-containing protein [Steroidobacteraceae bacterium]|jgi:cardiolipin synthase